MTVRLDFDEETISPLIQKHLDGGASVRAQIEEAVLFYNRCLAFIDAGKAIAAGTPSRGYFNNFEVIKGKKDGEAA